MGDGGCQSIWTICFGAVSEVGLNNQVTSSIGGTSEILDSQQMKMVISYRPNIKIRKLYPELFIAPYLIGSC